MATLSFGDITKFKTVVSVCGGCESIGTVQAQNVVVKGIQGHALLKKNKLANPPFQSEEHLTIAKKKWNEYFKFTNTIQHKDERNTSSSPTPYNTKMKGIHQVHQHHTTQR